MKARTVLRRLAAACACVALVLATVAAMPDHGRAQQAASPVSFEAVAAKGGPRLSETMKLIVWSLQGSRAEAVVARAEGVPTQISLEPGAYRVVAIYGTARRVQDIEVTGAAQETHLINLRAGNVALRLRPSRNAGAVRDAMEWRIHSYRQGEGKGDEIAKVLADRPSLLLREGWYQVEVDYNGRTVGHVIEVGAGRNLTYTLLAQ